MDDVQQTRARRQPPADADLIVDTRRSPDHAVGQVTALLGSPGQATG